MPKVIYEILADNNAEPCSRCHSMEWQRIAMRVLTTLTESGEVAFPRTARDGLPQAREARMVICVACLAFAMECITGWKMRSLIERYRHVSPLYEGETIKFIASEIASSRSSTKYVEPKTARRKVVSTSPPKKRK